MAMKTNEPSQSDLDIVLNFFEKMKALKLRIVIWTKNFATGKCDPKTLLTIDPEKLFVSSAWTGFVVDGIFYRTELIVHAQEFVAWCKEVIKSLMIPSENSDTEWRHVYCPQGVQFY